MTMGHDQARPHQGQEGKSLIQVLAAWRWAWHNSELQRLLRQETPGCEAVCQRPDPPLVGDAAGHGPASAWSLQCTQFTCVLVHVSQPVTQVEQSQERDRTGQGLPVGMGWSPGIPALRDRQREPP